MESLLEQIDKNRIPRHIAIIMDGNGRWAKQRGNARSSGHVAGVGAVRRTIEAAARLGVEYLTLYAFSTENWNRPKEEVDMLLSLIVSSLTEETDHMKANNVSLHMIGDFDRLPSEALKSLTRSIGETSSCDGLQVNLALSYSSRWELTEACRQIAAGVADGSIDIDSISEQTVSDHLTTASMPDPDILIRTGGDERISNFLLWQIAYSELYFTDIYWPEFDADSLYRAVIEFQRRERRFGMTSEQIMNLK